MYGWVFSFGGISSIKTPSNLMKVNQGKVSILSAPAYIVTTTHKTEIH